MTYLRPVQFVDAPQAYPDGAVARLAGGMPRFVNKVLGVPWIAKTVLWAGGMDTRRQVPEFA